MKTGGIILAAGMSSRMHDFKPMLPFQNTTISRYVVSLMKSLGIDPIIVITGFRSEDLEQHLFLTGVRFLKNEHYETTQMFDSLKLGINALKDECDRIVIMPVDVPAISLDTYKMVLEQDAQTIRTMYKGRPGHPIIIRKDAYNTILEHNGEGGLRGAMENTGLELLTVQVDDGAVWRDVDTKEEYHSLVNWVNEGSSSDTLHPIVTVRLATADVFFGPGVRDLIRAIDKTGSINAGCQQMGISYSKGVKMIRNAEEQFGVKIIKTQTGGIGGGGASVTPEGFDLLYKYQQMLAEVQENTEKIFLKYFK